MTGLGINSDASNYPNLRQAARSPRSWYIFYPLHIIDHFTPVAAYVATSIPLSSSAMANMRSLLFTCCRSLLKWLVCFFNWNLASIHRYIARTKHWQLDFDMKKTLKQRKIPGTWDAKIRKETFENHGEVRESSPRFSSQPMVPADMHPLEWH